MVIHWRKAFSLHLYKSEPGIKLISASKSGWSEHALALKKDGTLWAWGGNTFDEIGDGTLEKKYMPVLIGSGFTTISAGDRYSLALKENGTFWAWGRNQYGQLGDGTLSDKNSPVRIGSDFTAIVAGGSWLYGDCAHSMALKKDGSLWTWGSNDVGQLGNGSYFQRNAPEQIGSGYSRIATGGLESLALKPDGTLWMWGDFVTTPKKIGPG